jgi:hypothetical protein
VFSALETNDTTTLDTRRGEIHDVFASDDHFVIRPGRDAERIGKFWSYPQRHIAELLIDCEEDRTLERAGRDAAGV